MYKKKLKWILILVYAHTHAHTPSKLSEMETLIFIYITEQNRIEWNTTMHISII